MKNFNVLLLTILIIVSGIIFTSCPTGGPRYCPYCKALNPESIVNMYNEPTGGFRCKACGRTFMAGW